MTYSQQDDARDRQRERAAVFVDYENLYRTLGRIVDDGSDEVDLISEMLDALQRSLFEDRQAQSAVARAYADFASLEGPGERIQRTLYLDGIEPHYVPDTRRDNSVELELCVDAMDLLHHRTDISTFVLLTGRRIYLPLVRIFRRYGRRVLVFGLEEPKALETGAQADEGWFFAARDLLRSASRSSVRPSSRPSRSQLPEDGTAEIDDPILLQTLDIIDEYFGQYEEVYLTPLLRKLSELLDERRYDPKNLISDLEDCRAVRLEKRQGFPHDYTVLILEDNHPSVARILMGRQPRERLRHDDHPSSYDEFDEADSYDELRYNGEATYDEDESYHAQEDEDDLSDAEDYEETNPPT